MNSNFKKLNVIAKTLLKLTNKKEYIKYKWNLLDHKKYTKRTKQIDLILSDNQFRSPDQIIEIAKKNGKLNLIHSGNAGDIIYALPTIRSIKKLINVPLNFYLRLDQPHDLNPNYIHPLGNVTLNLKMADMLMPLLSELEYIDACSVYTNEDIDIKLDLFREIGINLDRGNIIRWYNYTTGIVPLVNEPWLKVIPDLNFSKKIVIARSGRYRNPHISYSFLRDYKNLCFIGVESEFEDIQKDIPHIEFIKMNSFLQMAQVIAGSAFFIGNQSFPYSVAEALKIPRIMETSFEAPNVIPDGANGYDFYLQPHFEWLVKHLNERIKN